MSTNRGDAIQVQVTEDWQRDAITLVPYRRVDGGTRVGRVEMHPGAVPIFRLMFQPHQEDPSAETDPGEVGLSIQADVAQALYQALGRYFGDHQDPASRELVDVLKEHAKMDAARVDRLVDHLTRPQPGMTITGGALHLGGPPIRTDVVQ